MKNQNTNIEIWLQYVKGKLNINQVLKELKPIKIK